MMTIKRSDRCLQPNTANGL